MAPISQLLETLRSRAFGLRALIADFDSASLENLSSYIKEIGMEVITAKDGLTALELFRTQMPQIIFLEAMLPKISGFELCQQINIESQGKVPVVIITGIYKDSRHKVEAIQTYKAAAFMTKPWQREDLAKTILDVLGPAVKPAEDEEELLLESLEDITPLIKERSSVPIPNFSPQPQSTVKETKVKKSAPVSDEVDKLLEKTLADLGFNGQKRVTVETKKEALFKEDLLKVQAKPQVKTVAPSPEIKPKQPEPKPFETKKPEPPTKEIKATEKPAQETEIKKQPEIKKPPVSLLTKESFIDTEKQPFASPPLLDKKVPEKQEIKPSEFQIRTSVVTEKEAEARIKPSKPTLYPDYFETEHEEKKRPSFFILFGIAGAVVLTLLGIFVFKSKKEAPLPLPPAAETEKVMANQPQDLPTRLEEQETTIEAPETEEVAAKLDSRLSSILPVKKEEPPPEKPPVLVAESSPTPLVLPATPSAVEVENKRPPVKETSENQPETKPAPQPAPKPEPLSPQIKEGDLLTLEEVDIQPRPIKRVEPRYPERARQMGLEGIVVVNALISENGDVLRTEILRGIKDGAPLEQAAQAAIRQWKFSPAMKNGVKVKVWKPIEARFRLDR